MIGECGNIKINKNVNGKIQNKFTVYLFKCFYFSLQTKMINIEKCQNQQNAFTVLVVLEMSYLDGEEVISATHNIYIYSNFILLLDDLL